MGSEGLKNTCEEPLTLLPRGALSSPGCSLIMAFYEGWRAVPAQDTDWVAVVSKDDSLATGLCCGDINGLPVVDTGFDGIFVRSLKMEYVVFDFGKEHIPFTVAFLYPNRVERIHYSIWHCRSG